MAISWNVQPIVSLGTNHLFYQTSHSHSTALVSEGSYVINWLALTISGKYEIGVF